MSLLHILFIFGVYFFPCLVLWNSCSHMILLLIVCVWLSPRDSELYQHRAKPWKNDDTCKAVGVMSTCDIITHSESASVSMILEWELMWPDNPIMWHSTVAVCYFDLRDTGKCRIKEEWNSWEHSTTLVLSMCPLVTSWDIVKVQEF